jgi:membrane-associated HD superfamily phosphohydrolase
MITFYRYPLEECSNKSRVLVFAGKESDSSQTAVIIYVPTVASVLLIICIYIFYLRVSRPGREMKVSEILVYLSLLLMKDMSFLLEYDIMKKILKVSSVEPLVDGHCMHIIAIALLFFGQCTNLIQMY